MIAKNRVMMLFVMGAVVLMVSPLVMTRADENEVNTAVDQTFTIVLEETWGHPVYTWSVSSYDRNHVVLQSMDSVVLTGNGPILERHFTFMAVQAGETTIDFTFDSIYPDVETGQVTTLRSTTYTIYIEP